MKFATLGNILLSSWEMNCHISNCEFNIKPQKPYLRHDTQTIGDHFIVKKATQMNSS